MTDQATAPDHPDSNPDIDDPTYRDRLVEQRIEKLTTLRVDVGVNPYGRRTDGLNTIAAARGQFVPDIERDQCPVVKTAGRVMLHRDGGKLHWLTIRDHTGDLQIAVSKRDVDETSFAVIANTDLGDILVAQGPLMKTRTGEITVWASSVEMHCKSLSPPPDKFHGLEDPEQRTRHRYIDMYVNPEVTRTLQARSAIITEIRRFMAQRDFLEVDTPMLQSQAGGAAARPFVTHLNALDIDVFLRIAPELYLKRLLVGGLPRVYEINRNFRNEGVDRSHNPEFTSMEVYEAFGNYETMRDLTEDLLRHLALMVAPDGIIEWSGHAIDYKSPFRVVTYAELFEQANGFDMANADALLEKAKQLEVPNADRIDQWLLINEVFEHTAEVGLIQPTFVIDYPSAISPLTRPREDNPDLCERWDLFIGEMEIGPAYTELNDPAIQRAKFNEQLAGAGDEDTTFRTLDEDFLHALTVGMPPAGGMGLGIDRVVMLLTGNRSIRDVLPFPFVRPKEQETV